MAQIPARERARYYTLPKSGGRETELQRAHPGSSRQIPRRHSPASVTPTTWMNDGPRMPLESTRTARRYSARHQAPMRQTNEGDVRSGGRGMFLPPGASPETSSCTRARTRENATSKTVHYRFALSRMAGIPRCSGKDCDSLRRLANVSESAKMPKLPGKTGRKAGFRGCFPSCMSGVRVPSPALEVSSAEAITSVTCQRLAVRPKSQSQNRTYGFA